MFCFPPHPLTRLRLADGVSCRLEPGRAELTVRAQTTFVLTEAPVLRLLGALGNGKLTAVQGEDLAGAERVLVETGLATVEFRAAPQGEVVAALSSTGYGQALRLDAPPPDWQLQRHAALQPDGAGWRLSSPLSTYEMQVADAGLLDRLRARSADGADGLAALLARALWAGVLTEQPTGGDGAAQCWSHEDLVFHRASRRHADHRPRGKRAARPAWAEAVPGAAPSAPLGTQLRQRLQSLSFEAVLATRRSVRGPLPPATLDELRNLLQVVQAERGTSPTAPCRAYPTAGGLQSLDFHLVTAAGPGAAATLYRFDAAAGLLQAVPAPAGSVQRLLDDAAQAWGETHGTPCALVVVTARLPELAARYEATAYRLALLEAGGAALLLAQVATALGLGSCVLGNGDSALFAWASGLPEWQSPAIAEIAIAGCLPDQR